jgi:hypothetical protein
VSFYGAAESGVEMDLVGIEGQGAEAKEERRGGAKSMGEGWAAGGCFS